MRSTTIVIILSVAVFSHVCGDNDDSNTQHEDKIDEKELEYKKGSLCTYCSYCKFCKLCDEDCPCETSVTKPNCKMCKYCKYCYLCSAVCDTVCSPGGVLDTMSAAVFNALPSFNTEEINSDIDSVQHWIDKKKDEL